MIFTKPAAVLFALSTCSFAACDGAREPVPETGAQAITIPFAGVVAGAPFACGQRYDAIGTTGASITPADFRFYVHDVTVIDEAGNDVVVVLDDNDFQSKGVALLDFEDGTGACDTGSPATHTAITGTVPGGTDVAGVRFTIGVPDALNHLDSSVAKAPFNIPSLWWSWAGGYRYMRIDALVGDDELAAFFHHGSTTCKGTPDKGFSCAYGNLIDVELDFADGDEVVVDIAELYKPIDLDGALAEGDAIRGCMAFAGDPQCVGMFATLGLTFEENGGTPTQTVFSAR